MTDQRFEHQRFEHEIRAALDEGAPMRPPNHLLHSFEFNARRTRRYPRWLALIKEPTMRTDSHLAVGSPMARALAIAIATLLLAVALASVGVAGQQLLAANGPIVVDQSGDGDFNTIGAAVAAASDGDEVVIRPGRYRETVIIDKDLTVRGEGEVVVVAPEEGPMALTYGRSSTGERYAMLLSDASGSVAGLTFRGEHSLLIVTGGSPTVEDNVLDGVGFPFGTAGASYDGSSIVLNGGTSAEVRGNTLTDGGPIAVFGKASPTIEENVLEGGPHFFLASDGPDLIVRGNRVTGTLVQGFGMYSSGNVLIEGNHLSDLNGLGINLDPDGGSTGSDLVVRGNTIEDASIGIQVGRSAAPVIAGNTLTGNQTATTSIGAAGRIAHNVLTDNGLGLDLSRYPGEIADNAIEGGGAGILINDSTATIEGNEITGNDGRGIAIGGDSTATLTGNRSCDNGEDLWVADAAAPKIDDSNEICEHEAAE